MQLAEELVLLAGSQTLVSDHVVDGRLLRNLLLMGTGNVARGGGVQVDDVDGLAFVGDIGVHRDAMLAFVQVLEGHDLLAGEDRGVELEGDGHVAIGRIGGEGGISLDDVAVLIDDHAAVDDVAVGVGIRQMQLAEDLVFLTGGQALVSHLVVEDGLLRGLSLVYAGDAVGSGSVDLNDVDRLAFIGNVGMTRDVDAVTGQGFEGDDALARKRRCVERERERNRARAFLRRESDLSGYGVAVGVLEEACIGIIGILDVQRTGELVLLARRQSAVGDFVVDARARARLLLMGTGGIAGGGSANVHHMHGLALVGNVLVARYLDVLAALERQCLEGDEALALVEDRGVDVELDVDGAVRRLRRELGSGLCARHDSRVSAVGGALVQRAGHDIGATGLKVLISDRIGQLDRALAALVGYDLRLMLAVGIGHRGGDGRNAHGLALIGDIGVDAHRDALAGYGLEGDQRLAAEHRGVDVELERDGAARLLGRELFRSRVRLAVAAIQDAAVSAVVVLDMQHAGDLVLLADREVGIRDGVDDGHIGLGLGHLLAGCLLRGLGAHLGETDGLAVVGDVGVGRHLIALPIQVLEEHDRLTLERGSVDVDAHLDLAGSGLRRKGADDLDRIAVDIGEDADVLAVAPQMHRGVQLVYIAGCAILIAHGVGELHRRRGQALLLDVAGSLGRNLGLGNLDGLPLIAQVLMLGHIGAVVLEVEIFEAHKLLVAELGGVDVDVHTDVPRGDGVGEQPGRTSDLSEVLAVLVDGMDDGRHGVVAAFDVLEVDLVRERHGFRHRHLLAAFPGKGGGKGDERVLLDALVDVHSVLGDRDGELDQIMLGIGGAGELVDVVDAVRQGAHAIVRRYLVIGVTVEPHAGRAVGDELGLVGDSRLVGVERGVARVGVLAVLDERCRGVHTAVFIADDKVTLAGGATGHEERNARHLDVAGHLDLVEVEVAANDLLLKMIAGVRVASDDLAVLANLHRHVPVAVEDIALRGLGLAKLVGAVGQRRGRRGRNAVTVGHKGDGRRLHRIKVLAVGVTHAVDEHVLAGLVRDGDLGTGQSRRALGHGLVALFVDLGHADTAANNVIRKPLDAVDLLQLLVVLVNREGIVPIGVEKITCRGFGLLDGIRALDELRAELIIAVGIGLDGLDGGRVVVIAVLDRRILLAAHPYRVLRLVIHAYLGALEGRVALRIRLVELMVDLYARQLAPTFVDSVFNVLCVVHGLGLAVGADLNRCRPCLIACVSRRRRHFTQPICAVRQVLERILALVVCLACPDGGAGRVRAPVDHDGIGRRVDELDDASSQRGIALRLVEIGVRIGLGALDAAANDRLLQTPAGIDRIRLALLAHLDGRAPGRIEQIPFRSLRLANLICAVGNVLERPGAVVAGRRVLAVRAVDSDGLPVDDDRMLATVDELDRGAAERCIALRHGLVALRVDLGACDGACDDVIVHGAGRDAGRHLAQRLVPIDVGDRPVRVDAHDVGLAVQVIAGRIALLSDRDDADGYVCLRRAVVIGVPIIAADLARVVEARDVGAVLVDRLDGPGTCRALAQKIGSAVHAVRIYRIELDLELRVLERGITLRLDAVRRILLIEADSHGIRLRRLGT